MARIYKESRYVLQLLIGKSYGAQYDDVKISFYTKNPSNQVMVNDGITIKRNIAEVKIESTLFDNLEEGLISYIVYGTKDGIPFIEERQSNYFLKIPLDFKPTTCILEDKSVTPSMGERNNDGYIVVEEGEGYDGLSRVVIDPQTLYNEGINEQKSKLGTISITQNGIYSKEDGYNHIEVNVPDLNGSYDVGYGQGKTDGVNEQKSKLETINITQNGTYTKEDGYNQIDVNVPDLNGSYDEGKTDGINEQKSKLARIEITENGTYTKEDGYNHIEVNVPDLNGSYDVGYGQGKTDGVNEQKSKLVSINITQNGTYTKEDGYNQIEVNVNAIPKINIQKAGINFALSTFTEVPEWADFEGITNMENMFYVCENLQTIPLIDASNVTNMREMCYRCSNLQTIQLINTSNVTNMASMFDGCSNLQTIPQLNTSNVTNMMDMFDGCSNLQTIPQLDTSNVTNMRNMFYGCAKLTSIPQLNTSNVINMDTMFQGCRSLTSIPALNAQSLNEVSYYGIFGYSELPNLTDFGGFLNLKCSLTDDGNLKRLPNLTYQSCINILNGLYDFVGNGETPSSSQGQLKVHQNFLDKVGNEISIGTNKGWTITV